MRRRLPSGDKVRVEELESRWLMSTYLVDNFGDESDGNYGAGEFTLREAVELANLNTGEDTIRFSPTDTYFIEIGSDLHITDDLTIDWFDESSDWNRVAIVAKNSATIIIDDGDDDYSLVATFKGYYTRSIYYGGVSTLMRSRESLVLLDAIVTGDFAYTGEGRITPGIEHTGTTSDSYVEIRRSSFRGIDGGNAVLDSSGAASVIIDACSFTDNDVGALRIESVASVLVTNSTFAQNSSEIGVAGLLLDLPGGDAVVSNCTIIRNNSRNTDMASSGGIVMAAGTLRLNSTILSQNSLGSIGSVRHELSIEPGAAMDLPGSGNNLLYDADSAGWLIDGLYGNILGADPKLENGHMFFPLKQSSPAIDAGNNDLGLETDQRGGLFVRSHGGAADIGAYESQALDLVVDSPFDTIDGNYAEGELTLREAVTLTSATVEADTIRFDPSLMGATIVLAYSLSINRTTTIEGLGVDLLTIDGNLTTTLFTINNINGEPETEVTIQNLSLTRALDGAVVTGGRARVILDHIRITDCEGELSAVTNGAKVFIYDSEITGNHSDIDGGAIRSNGPLHIWRSVISGNTAGGDGGAIFTTRRMSVTDSTLEGNTASGFGGAITGSMTITVSGCEFVGNSADAGGAIYCSYIYNNTGWTSVTDSTFEGNHATTDGGAVLGRGIFTGCEFSNNSSGADGGAVYGLFNSEFTIERSTFISNEAGARGGGLLAHEATITDSTFERNEATDGGALYVGRSVLATGCLFDRNTATERGGAILTSGELELSESTLSLNAARSGGAIFSKSELLVTRSTFTGNSASERAGAVLHTTPEEADALVEDSLFVDNQTDGDGGAMWAASPISLTNSTLSANLAGNTGGAVFIADGTTTLRFCTLANNTASEDGGAVHIEEADGDALLVTLSTLYARNLVGDVPGTFGPAGTNSVDDSSAYNLVDSVLSAGGLVNGESGNLVGVDPRLRALADNGGPTLTHALEPGSPAVDATDDTIEADQRGVGRPVGLGADIGAYESGVILVRDGSSLAVSSGNQASHHVVAWSTEEQWVVFTGSGEDWTAELLDTGGAVPVGDAVTWTNGAGLGVIAGPTDFGLVLFTETTGGTWTPRNLSTELGVLLDSPVRSLTTIETRAGRMIVAGYNELGEIVAFRQVVQGGVLSWTFINISDDLTSQGMTTPDLDALVGYATPWNAWNLAGIDADGNIQAVWVHEASFTDWRVDNLSAITGAGPLTGQLSVTQTSWRAINLGGLDESGRLMVTWWVPGGSWATSNLSSASGAPTLNEGQLTGFVTSWGAINYVGVDAEERAIAIWWTPSTGWKADPLVAPGEAPTGSLTSHTAADRSISVFGTAASGEAVRVWWMPGASWMVSSLSELAAV